MRPSHTAAQSSAAKTPTITSPLMMLIVRNPASSYMPTRLRAGGKAPAKPAQGVRQSRRMSGSGIDWLRDVRAFQMGVDQAQEGDRRLSQGQAVHQARAGDHGRRT